MDSYIEAYEDKEMSSTSQHAFTRHDQSDDQLPSTVEFQTNTDGDAEQLASTMKVYTESEDDDLTESDNSTSSMVTSFAIAQFQMLWGHLYDMMYVIMVYAYGPNPDPRVVMMFLMRIFRD